VQIPFGHDAADHEHVEIAFVSRVDLQPKELHHKDSVDTSNLLAEGDQAY
jgi:hypothetical protein